MNALDLGITQEELREQIIDRAAERLVEEIREGDHGQGRLREIIQDTVGEVARKVADEEIRPWAESQIDTVVMQRTNEWGETVGEPVTFRQYLVKMAEQYIVEPVDYEGKTKAESRGFSWSESQTRITHLIHKHLHYEIEGAMKSALATANSAIAGGIQEAVKIKLREVTDGLKLTVVPKR
jgi:hypothetical protein